MTTSESKGRFFLQNESIRKYSRNESNLIDSNRELECSSVDLMCVCVCVCVQYDVRQGRRSQGVHGGCVRV